MKKQPLVNGEIYFNAIESNHGKADLLISCDFETINGRCTETLFTQVHDAEDLQRLDFNVWQNKTSQKSDYHHNHLINRPANFTGGVGHILGLVSSLLENHTASYQQLYQSYKQDTLTVKGSITPFSKDSCLRKKGR